MVKRTACSIEGCTGGPPITRGWCLKHYSRWLTHGDPHKALAVILPGGPADRLWARVDVGHPLGCWLWTGGCDGEGYGLISVGGRGRTVHRFAYELLMGPIPDGLTLDHLCRVRHCVNPDHLEPVTPEENTRRGYAPSLLFSKNGRCQRGHVLTEENIYRWQNTQCCRLCRNERARANARQRKRRHDRRASARRSA